MTTSQKQREHRKFLRSIEWAVQRSRVIVRSNGICELCKKSRVKQVHHRRYADPIGSTPDSDLVAICGRCHRNAHVTFSRVAATTEIKLF
jgi:5-methylcytosine-specific restriction endonuclease McrA